MRKQAISFLVLSSFLCSCNSSIESTPLSSDTHLYIDDFPDEDLRKPSREISSREEFIYALDYLTFYQITDTVYFQITDDYKKNFFNIYQEFLQAKKCTEIADVFQIDLDRNEYEEGSLVGLTLFYDPTFSSEKPVDPNYDSIFIQEFDYQGNLNIRGEDFNGFYIEKADLDEAEVSNSEQLYYVLLNGYKPVCTTSITEQLYDEMKVILRRLISDDMSEIEKIKQVYNFLTSEVRYDTYIVDAGGTEPFKSQSYYLEGVILNRYGVCDSKAKAFVSLLAIEGIEAKRIAAEDEDSKHAYNLVKADGTWYLTCSTYGSNRLTIADQEYVVPSYNMFLTTLKTPYESWNYQSQMHSDLQSLVSEEPYDYYAANNLIFDDTQDVLNLVLDYSHDNSLRYKKFEFALEKVSIEEVIDAFSKADFTCDYSFFSESNIALDTYSVMFY